MSEHLSKTCVSIAEPRWYAASTKPCHEKRVAEHLQVRKIELFLPLYQTQRHWKNGCNVTLHRPLFPGYVFVRIPVNERVRVLELSSVLSIVGTGRTPIALPDDEIARLRAGLPQVHAQPHPVLTVGETARICRGPLQGMTGVITRHKNTLRVVLTVELIMKSVAVEVSVYDIEPVSQPAQPASKALAIAAGH